MVELLARQAIEERVTFQDGLGLLVLLLRRARFAAVDLERANRERNRDLAPPEDVPGVGVNRVARFGIATVRRHRELDLVNDGRFPVLAQVNLRWWMFFHSLRLPRGE